MSSRLLSNCKLANKTFPAKAAVTPWVRPADWLTLPTLTDSDQKFVGLHAVYPDSNFLALSAAGNYTVNWGDGLTEDFATGVVAYHQYDYNDADLAGTECSRGYKQAIVTVTPQSGQNLTTLNLHLRHNQNGLAAKYSSGFLDITIAGSLLTSLLIGSQSAGSATQVIKFGLLEQVILYSNALTSFSYLFNNCYNLASIPALNVALGTNFSSMFNSCFSLLTIPLMSVALGTNFSSMFFSCSRLTSIPLLNTALGTNFSGLFNSCFNLGSIPALNVALGTNFSSLFNNDNQVFKSDLSNCKYSVDYTFCKLSQAAIENICTNLGKASGAQTLTISSNWGAPTPVSLSGTSTANSTTITMASTTGITADMQVTGTGSPLTTALACSFTDTGDTVGATAHGLSNGDLVSFATIVTTTGIITYTPYFVVGATADTFQLALTAGGSAIALTTNGTGTLLYTAKVVTVNTNTSVVLDRPMSASGTNTFAYRLLNTNIALLKGWTVNG
jgi:hypothetical protein